MGDCKTSINQCRHFLSLCIIALMGGCVSAPSLMPTPVTYVANQSFPKTEVPVSLQTNRVPLIYATDRAIKTGTGDQIEYGAARSPALHFGMAQISVGENIAWSELVEASNTANRSDKLIYHLDRLTELGQYPSTPYPFEIVDSHPRLLPDVQKAKDIARSTLQQEIKTQLAVSEKKDVILFVHGFNNSLEKALYTLAGIWHFNGRQGVPVVYSWPAAAGGLLGYFVDRESGEYTIFHLKETLRLLFETPEIENIHIIAHSRGTDVTTSALRELLIETRGRGEDPKDYFKVRNLILAAPDLDFGVISQRLMAERFALGFDQITIYTTQSDKALGFAQRIMSGIRFGRVRSRDLSSDQRKIFAAVGNVNLIQVNQVKGFLGHGYFHSNPAVSSDLVTLLQTNAKPGSSARPLIRDENNFWVIPAPEPQNNVE